MGYAAQVPKLKRLLESKERLSKMHEMKSVDRSNSYKPDCQGILTQRGSMLSKTAA